jgi:hypothetical protein
VTPRSLCRPLTRDGRQRGTDNESFSSSASGLGSGLPWSFVEALEQRLNWVGSPR